ncbi:Ribonuclease 3 [Rickettsiales endosymbiont of Paramecium tredecaurelia]|uniref:ribonuclease III n=1 Tax=Candidatus Sarmatiella mevalonica TaxID=2770581 RepID=UPI001923038A|nr:ribonuclease III [Candidatus Sarmatiella mevalonica]MBL3284716.1 Ribonuclease 3 [Candidatus Sarmatiella mevalonica]
MYSEISYKEDSCAAIQSRLGYRFKKPELLIEALSHPSLKHIRKVKVKDYQRLEFLGDAVLSFFITEFLFRKNPRQNEGSLAKMRSFLVCKDAIAQVANSIELSKYILMTAGEESSGGRDSKNNIENSMEAVIGALYLDAGIERARKIVLTLWHELLLQVDVVKTYDPKTELQELCQAQKTIVWPEYELVKKDGPDHAPIFHVRLRAMNYEVMASGSSMKTAQKDAALRLLNLIKSSALTS